MFNIPYKWVFALAGVPYIGAAIVALKVNDRCVTKLVPASLSVHL